MSDEAVDTRTGRQKLESAVTRVGRAYDELVRTVEKYGEQISQEDLAKVFAFLGEVHAGSNNKASLSISTAIAANGGFSLDTFEPGHQSTVIVASAPALHLPPGAKGSRHQELVEHGGRLIGKKKSAPQDDDANAFLEE